MFPTHPTQYRDHHGNEVRLPSAPFARGGEGAVFDVPGKPELVAKLYFKPQSKERCDKLRAMAALCRPELLKIAAWPTATLNAGKSSDVVGILMPKVMDYLEIHHLYSVVQRKKDFPEADWGFLLHTARNCAIAFESIHAHGHVVGDVNQKNVMVSKKGVVAFVDCDSFQVALGSRIFRCGVGVPEYTPPELHGKAFASLDRAANHDLFGLAVLIFHLLMMGRHPFSGVSKNVDIPLAKAIQAGDYAYTRNKAKARLAPPPQAPPMTMLDPTVVDLFERAFGSTRRPSATEWKTTLDETMKQLVRCKIDLKHSYPAAAGKCPWCQLSAGARIMFFLPNPNAFATSFRPEDVRQFFDVFAGMRFSASTYVRPKPTQPIPPIQVMLPAGLRFVNKPTLVSPPPAPDPIPMPTLAPPPPPPSRKPPPSLKPLPPPSAITRPAPKPHPPAPIDLPRPKLAPLPPRPHSPPWRGLGPSDDLFFIWICACGAIGGVGICFIAVPLGLIAMIAFGLWLFLILVTADWRRERALKSLVAAYQVEWNAIDEEYAEQCRPFKAANQRLLDEWTNANSKRRDRHSRLCKAVDENNHFVIAQWESVKTAIEGEYERVTGEITRENQRILAAWKAENDSRQAAHDQERREIEFSNKRRIDAWESLRNARRAEHDRACRKVDEANRSILAAWRAANQPWTAETHRRRDQLAKAEAKIRRLEAEIATRRKASAARFQKRKDDAKPIVENFNRVKRDYETDLKKAEADSERIQLKTYLEGFLIRDAKIPNISNRCILSMESFGIETADEIEMLNIINVPDVDHERRVRLFAWRDGLKSRFKPKQTLPESEKKRIADRYASILGPLRQEMQDTLQELKNMIELHQVAEVDLLKAVGKAVQDAAIAEAHVQAMDTP